MKAIQIVRECEPASALVQAHTSPPLHILVVEDDVCTRQLNTEALVQSGYDVDAAEDGATAWKALNTDSYDLMITDNSMPKVSGVELLKKLHAAHMALPVIMATGTLPAWELVHGPWLQPDATLLKPYTTEEMLRTVKKVLRETGSTADAGLQTQPNLPRRILVVDEDSDLRRLYTDALARPSFHIDIAKDGATAWKALQARNYNLLITENDLPDVTGVELVRKLRAAHMALPVVMTAGRLPTEELALDPSLQLAAMLVKPFAVDALLDTVQNVLRATDRPREQTAPPPGWQSLASADGFRLI